MYSNELYRLQSKHTNCYRRQNYSIDRRTDNNKNIVYRISPVGFARSINIRDKGQIIYGRIFIPTNDNRKGKDQVHPFYRFLMKSLIVYQYLLKSQSQTETELINELIKQITDGIHSSRKEEIKVIANSVIDEVFEQMKDIKDSSLMNMSRIKKLKIYNNMMKTSQQKLRLQIEEILAANPGRYGPHIKCNRDLVFSQIYLSKQIASLKAIEPLKISQQEQKLKNFLTRHSLYFEAALLNERPRGFFGCQHIRINRFSDQSQPVIQTLGQFIQLHFDNANDYRQQTDSFIRDMYTQLMKYSNSTAETGHRMGYIWLNIDSVVVDQFKLFPKLHFDPPLKQALGMTNQPESTEIRLLFHPTPKGPDCFRSPEEFSEQVQMMLKDPYYGNLQNELKLTSSEQNIVRQQRIQLDLIKQKIVFWRFLLVAYYIRNGHCFGRMVNPKSNVEIEEHFLSQIIKKQKQIQNNEQKLQDFLGSPSKKYRGNISPNKIEELGEYLSLNNDDSVIRSHNYAKKIKYLSLKWKLGQQIVNILLNSHAFYKIINAKKYFMMLLISGIQIFEQARVLIVCEHLKMGERQSLRAVLQRSNKNNLKLNYEFAKTRFERLNIYMSRQMKDPSTAYLKQNSNYHFKLVEQVFNGILEIHKISQSLNQYEDKREVPTVYERNAYREQTKKALAIIQIQLAKTRTIFLELIYIEIQMRSAYEILHKVPDNQPLTRNAYQCFTKRYIVLMMTYFTLNQNNFVLYESSVVPMIIFSDNNNKPGELNNLKIAKTRNDIDTEQLNLKTLGEVINYKQMFPKRLAYLKSPISEPNEIQNNNKNKDMHDSFKLDLEENDKERSQSMWNNQLQICLD